MQVQPDTLPPSERPGFERYAMRALALIALGLSLAGCATSGAPPLAPGPSVVWASHDRVYVASRDSMALEPGDSVWFEQRGKAIAMGRVASKDAGGLAAVTLSMGAIADSHFDGIHVVVERSKVHAMESLRVGYPSAKRIASFFACWPIDIHAPGPAGMFVEYRFTSARSMQRIQDVGGGPPWPENLEPKVFDEASDEEIALERGEIDVAVFWPGELSAPMRKDPRWAGSPSGLLRRGVFALAWNEGGVLDSSLALDSATRSFASLNRDLFRGDLRPLSTPHDDPGLGNGPLWPVRVEADPSCPSRAELQRYFDRMFPGSSPPPIAARARLVYVQVPVVPADSVRHEAAEVIREAVAGTKTASLLDERRTVPLFAVGCPVVCAPELRRYVTALTPDSLVNLVDCRPGSAKP